VETRKIVISLLALVWIAVAIPSCGPTNQEPEVSATPHFVNDLSSLSSRPVVAISDPHAAYVATQNAGDSTGHAFQDRPGNTRHVGTDTMPATQQLLNPKAAQFGKFSSALLDQLWGQLRLREGDDDITKMKVPETLKTVVLTATLAPDGKLQEIVIEQRSGKTAVDKLFIDAAKKSIWTHNPPRAAALPNGTYQVRIEGRIENFASQKDKWTFTTYMGIAVL
jgi:hypothetical protein